MDIKSVLGDLEVQAKLLDKQVKGLKIEKTNHLKDNHDLKAENNDLRTKNKKLSEYLAGEVKKATAAAVNRITEKESDIDVEKARAIDERIKVTTEKATYEAKSYECDKLKKKLEIAIRNQEATLKEAADLKTKLLNVIDIAKGAL